MHVISRRALLDYAEVHANVREELNTWYHTTSAAAWQSIHEMKLDFPATDLVRGSDSRFIFNLKGNHYRLLTVVRFRFQRVYIRKVMTHAEYSKYATRQLLEL